ncbi:MAG TPA: galactokinase family protein [Vicinamibacterales bacterium]|nr:galactokinase family protein [Vicinamibacterales bacterium]
MSIHIPDATDLAGRLESSGLRAAVARQTGERFVTLLRRLSDGAAREPWSAWFVPGRIEVLGKHTDYAGGRSLICTVERGICVVATGRSDDRLSIADLTRDSSIALRADDDQAAVKWGTYPLTVLRRVTRNFPGALRGVDMCIDSDLPSAAGLSSSSALMIAVLLAMAHLNTLEAAPAWKENIATVEDLAAYAATIENGSGFGSLAGERGVGTEGGSQDHTAILCSVRDRISQYAFRPTLFERSIALPAQLTFAIAMSGVRAQKTGNAQDDYNRASRAVAALLARANADAGRSDSTLAQAIGRAPDALDRIRALVADGEPRLRDRLEQFVAESTVLVPAAGDALEHGDYAAFGTAVARSQEFAERLLHNQIPETIALARLAREQGALAASAFGAGFGGSVWALSERERASSFLDRWHNAYASAHPESAARSLFFLSRPGPAAFRLPDR